MTPLLKVLHLPARVLYLALFLVAAGLLSFGLYLQHGLGLEPCPMCMSALVWAGIGGVVFATSIDGIRRAGIEQINITARTVIEQSPFYNGALLGGVLSPETDRMFLERKRS